MYSIFLSLLFPKNVIQNNLTKVINDNTAVADSAIIEIKIAIFPKIQDWIIEDLNKAKNVINSELNPFKGIIQEIAKIQIKNVIHKKGNFLIIHHNFV